MTTESYDLAEWVSDTYQIIVDSEGRKPKLKELQEDVFEMLVDRGLIENTKEERKRIDREVEYYAA